MAAVICENGHVVSVGRIPRPSYGGQMVDPPPDPFCSECGGRAIVDCEQCGRDLPVLFGKGPPAFCAGCRHPFPWTERGIEPSKRAPRSAAVRKLFISHAAADRPLGQYLGDMLHERGAPEVFLASRIGDICLGDGWFETITTELDSAASHLVVLTRNSIGSLWVAFESGGIYFAGRPRIFLCAGGLRKTEVPHPFADLQLLSLDEDGAPAVAELFRVLGARPPDNAEAFIAAVAVKGQEVRVSAKYDAGWRYVEHDSRIFAWEGPLDAMNDRDAVQWGSELDPGFCARFPDHGVSVLWVRPEGLGQRPQGIRQVFVTDLETWRRPVVCRDTVLAVKPLQT